MIVPPVFGVTEILYVIRSPLGLLTLEMYPPAAAVPEIVGVAFPKPLTGSLQTAVNLIGVELVGSGWSYPNGSVDFAWFTVTVGPVLSMLTVLLPEEPMFPAASLWLAAKV